MRTIKLKLFGITLFSIEVIDWDPVAPEPEYVWDAPDPNRRYADDTERLVFTPESLEQG